MMQACRRQLPLGGLLLALLPVTASARAGDQAVVSGEARFEVLSPTLIRTEYAADGKFFDASTFNVVGRDKFPATPFASSIVDGWLTVTTSAVTLRYQVNSGPFSARNLQVTLKAGAEAVSAAPWDRLLCAADRRCEAEDARLSGAGLASDHLGFTGAGFVAGLSHVGDSIAFDVDAAAGGPFAIDLRYANSTGGDGRTASRTLSLSVDGAAPQTISLPVTANWDTWAIAGADVTLAAGTHTITLSHGSGDSGNVNVDSVALASTGAGFPSMNAAHDCLFGSTCEAEASSIGAPAFVQADHTGYAGTGFIGNMNQGSSVTAHVVAVPVDGTYDLQLRYANSTGGDGLNQARVANVTANGSTSVVVMPPTVSWDSWSSATASVQLHAGQNDVAIACPDPTGCHVNIDSLAVTAARAGTPSPRIALGGYRRSLDNVTNSAPVTPGLLFRNGWGLVDDSVTAKWKAGTRTLVSRSARGGGVYQDGYVFGYGHDYPAGLKDLSRLTGSNVLLPRWAYGVWYSEYYDHTQADFENVIVPQFRANATPLDVLVVDTDFKTPAQWNGWEIDPVKFPDPTGFFSWAHSQGLHTTLNIHPSIVESDPQYAQAQATAKNKLAAGGCPGCRFFDWSDPDQLAAYFGLHQGMEQLGVDFWWLDWCCTNDPSIVARTDVTADAWINEQYTEDENKLIGRGFAFSRAYGSGWWNNQPNLPTGPWADKRTTLHFTGDTTSNWGVLSYEVGYTAGESASTGLSTISHDIGGHNNAGDQTPGAEPGTTRLPEDLYVRWVQFGTFQPVLRLHGNHSDRLPWQYGPAAQSSAQSFLRLRESLVPTTYTLARQGQKNGLPIVRALYLGNPEDELAYAFAGSEYMYGGGLLVAPVTTPGITTSTTVYFPAGSWTDFFSGATHQGPSTDSVSTDWNAMPVFLLAGHPLITRADNAPNDMQSPMANLAVTVAAGASSGAFTLYEDDGKTTDYQRSATTKVTYRETGAAHALTIGAAEGSFAGQVAVRAWSVNFLNANPPTIVSVDGVPLSQDGWIYDASHRRLSVPVSPRSVMSRTSVSWQ